MSGMPAQANETGGHELNEQPVTCFTPSSINDLRTTADLEKFLLSHDWTFLRTEKYGNGFVVYMLCKRCKLERSSTMVSTRIGDD